jgi:hypothetical protein
MTVERPLTVWFEGSRTTGSQLIGQVSLDATARLGLNRLLTERPVACRLGQLLPTLVIAHIRRLLPSQNETYSLPLRYLLDTSVDPR